MECSTVNTNTFTNELPAKQLRPNFWQQYALSELTEAEWEALCDGCGACCLEKFLDVDEEPSDVAYTNVACRLLDCDTGYCSNYVNRHQFVPSCVSLTPENVGNMMWLPSNCAYKRLYLGESLPNWHLLITVNVDLTKQGMRDAGVGVAGRCVSEIGVAEEELEDRIIQWVTA